MNDLQVLLETQSNTSLPGVANFLSFEFFEMSLALGVNC